jgi:hypothetical protein
VTQEQFEALLNAAANQLGKDVRESTKYHDPAAFQSRVFEVLKLVAKGQGIEVTPSWHPHAFPDILANGFGIEVKTTIKDSWLSVGNSVFEGMRDQTVTQVYVVFGKMGGLPSVRWGRYEEAITHVRISHAPRFVLEMDRNSSLFEKMAIRYDEFAKLPPEDKMRHIRQYSRGRLKPGERLWWLEDGPDESQHTLPIQIRLYMSLPQGEKIRLRAEAALLCPQIVKPSRTRNKYNDAALYLLTYHGVFCPQTRDLFSAGSVALRSDETRGGIYILRALQDIEVAMRDAALSLDDALFEEYWGTSVPPKDRITEWLVRADKYARNWSPSKHLFLDR